jgi:hypothetical protein
MHIRINTTLPTSCRLLHGWSGVALRWPLLSGNNHVAA